MTELEKRYDFKKSEKKWKEFWEKESIFKFSEIGKGKEGNKKIYSVDTPPPTLSGEMHIGHAFSYAQQDFIVRYMRMKGLNVYYPFGTDDNGLPTERLVERLKKVKSKKMKRGEFVKLCQKTIKEILPKFIQTWKDIGMSCDFSNPYSTIDNHCIKTSQKSFIELFKKKLVYRKKSPVVWCTNCQTAIAQAELEDKQKNSLFIDVKFKLTEEKENKRDKIKRIKGQKESLNNSNKEVTVSTTRPELLPACVALFVNPDDKKNKKLIGKKVMVPIFGQEVKIYADKSADPEKGTGILMVCSYGDKYDVEAISKLKLKSRVVFREDGKMNELAGKYKGLEINEAREKIIEDLSKKGLISGKKKISHVVNVHDKCGTEIEFLESKQWFIKILDKKKKFLEAANKINWYPKTMKKRYDNWVKGLQWDWGISRQRHFGVPFPLWYCGNCGAVILADEKKLPVDPLKDKPAKCLKCGSQKFVPELDVLDTWATSSLTPEIILNWIKDKNQNFSGINFKKFFPTNLRPQAHDIIRTWAFYTIVKSLYHFNKIPWKDIVISGHVLDPKGQSMHKSKGNVISPYDVLKKHGADCLRYWAVSSSLGEDLAYKEQDLKRASIVIIKLWNSSRFISMFLKSDSKSTKKKLELTDKWIFERLRKTQENYKNYFDKYEFSKAIKEVEIFFKHDFCDFYLEMIKYRLYGDDRKESALYTLYYVLLEILKMFSPVLCFTTEEIYQKIFREVEGKKSINNLVFSEFKFDYSKAEKETEKLIKIIKLIRDARQEMKIGFGKTIEKAELHCSDVGKIKKLKKEIRGIGRIKNIEFKKIKGKEDKPLFKIISLKV